MFVDGFPLKVRFGSIHLTFSSTNEFWFSNVLDTFTMKSFEFWMRGRLDACPCLTEQVILISPVRVNLKALLSRFKITCFSLFGSVSTNSGTSLSIRVKANTY